MKTLYEILNDMIGEDITQKFTAQEVQDVSDRIENKVRKDIGDASYVTLENYMIVNKDDVYLKSFTAALILKLDIDGISRAMKHVKAGLDKIEEVLGYKVLVGLHQVLRRTSYDAEQALLEL